MLCGQFPTRLPGKGSVTTLSSCSSITPELAQSLGLHFQINFSVNIGCGQ